MSDFLTPDMTLSLMSAAESDLAQQKASQMKKAKYMTSNRVLETTEGKSDPVLEAAQDFEAVFIAEMMKPMFADISTEAPFGGGKGEEVFRGMLLQEYGKIISKTGSIGLSDHIKTEMIRMQAQIDSGSSDIVEEHENRNAKGAEFNATNSIRTDDK